MPKLEHVGWAITQIWRRWPSDLLYFGAAPGDDLLCTAVARELKQRRRSQLWLMSQHADLFIGNPHVDRVVPCDGRFTALARRLGRTVHNLRYSEVIGEDQDRAPDRHIIAMLCERAGVRGLVKLLPEIFLDNGERIAGKIAPQQIAIQSSCLGATFPMRTKEWFAPEFQAVVDSLRNHFAVIQLGVASDPPLSGAVDMRGKTTKREAAAILANSVAFIGLVGFLMHLARAVNTRSVIVYGGREKPWQSGYSCNENLVSSIACSPCWRWSLCDHDFNCMREIQAAQVVEAFHRVVARASDPLEVDEALIASRPDASAMVS